MIKEIQINNPITTEDQPDGGAVPIVDPYDGCQLCCPYCFQQSDTNWNKDIYVKTNIADMLDSNLSLWDKSRTIYIGSRCDPYMPLEKAYRLTRRCLEVLNKWEIPTMLTTKSDTGFLLQDIDLFKSFHAPFTMLMDLSNINQAGKGADNYMIILTNTLYQQGIPVWAFITPILPYVMDVDAMIAAIHPNIPIYLDKLRVFENSIQSHKLEEWIHTKHPAFSKPYAGILYKKEDQYYQELKEKYKKDKRITFLFC